MTRCADCLMIASMPVRASAIPYLHLMKAAREAGESKVTAAFLDANKGKLMG